MTVSVRRSTRDVPVWDMAPSLQRLGRRKGTRPRLAAAWPCLQTEDEAKPEVAEALKRTLLDLPGAVPRMAPFDAPGQGVGLEEDLARGQPEAFIGGSCWVNLRPDGSMHLSLRPEWAQKVIDRGWATIHPFARYMAGAVPPQSLVVYAPRDRAELNVAKRIAAAAHGYAVGRIDGIVLPDTRW